MKFIALQSNFIKALNQVSRVVGTRTTLPVLSNVLISAEKGKIKLSATDLEVAVTVRTIGKIEEEGQLTVPARLLTDFISNNNDESIELSTPKENVLHLKSERYEANISGISAEEFPTVPELPKDHFCSIKIADFADALKKVLIAPANDNTRPVLAGIYFQFSNKILTLAATDSYRLAEIKIDLEEELEEKKFIVPARTMAEVLRLISGSDLSENIFISSTENQIVFKIGETAIVSRLIEGAYPNYAQIIPANTKIKIHVDHKELLNAVKMTSFFAKNSANNIRIKTEENSLVISSVASETGDSQSKIQASIDGGEISIAFNARYVLDVLQVLGDQKIRFELNDSMSSGVIRGEKDSSFIYIVMPLNI